MSQNLDNAEALLKRDLAGYELFYEKLSYSYDAAFFGRRPMPSQDFDGIGIDSEGFRSRKGMSWKAAENYGLLMGDSVTFGVGVVDSTELLSSQLERQMQLPIYDMSTRAFRIEQQMPLFMKHLSEGIRRPSRIMLWGGFCDLLWWILSGGCRHGHFGIEMKRGTKLTTRLVRRFLRLSQIFSPQVNHASLNQVPYWKNPMWKPCDLETFAEFVAKEIECFYKLSQGFSIDFLFLLQPMQVEPTKNRHADSALYCKIRSEWVRERQGSGFEDLATSFRGSLLGKIKQYGIPHIDTQALVDPSDFYDQVHLRPEAFARIAESFSRFAKNGP